jgi:hypothetical protein
MRRPTIALILIAVAALVAVIVVRSSDDAPGLIAGSSPTSVTSIGDDPTTTAVPTTTTSLAPGFTVPAGSTVCDLYGVWAPTGTIRNELLVEASGLAVSRTTEDVLWSHNDSRDGPRAYAFRPDGEDLGRFEVPGAFAFDWEDMAAGPDADGEGDFLYFGDIGDNFDIRQGIIAIHRVEDIDPMAMSDRFPASHPIALEYPEGNHNAEAMFVDPVDPAVYIVTKSTEATHVFRGSLVIEGPRTVLELIATLPLGAEVSGADISFDGSLIAFRGYRTVWLWTRGPGQTIADALAAEPCEGQSPDERQGEAIAIDSHYAYWTVSEGIQPAIHRVAFED